MGSPDFAGFRPFFFFSDFAEIRRDLARIIVHSCRNYCWGHVGKQQVTVEDILEKKCLYWEILKLRGIHCEFLNISGQIENHPKLQGANLYFPLIFNYFYKFVGTILVFFHVPCACFLSLIIFIFNYYSDGLKVRKKIKKNN